jgi:hypothetical protein
VTALFAKCGVSRIISAAVRAGYQVPNSASSALASLRSTVSKPSVNPL